jgi:hypothetical protein
VVWVKSQVAVFWTRCQAPVSWTLLKIARGNADPLANSCVAAEAEISVNVVSSRLMQLYWPLQRGRRTGGRLALGQGYRPHLTAETGRPALASPDRSAAFSSRPLLPPSPPAEKATARNHARKKCPTRRRGLELRGIPLWKVLLFEAPTLSPGFFYLGELSPEETEKAPCRSHSPNRQQGHPPTGRGLVTTHPRDGCVATSKKVCLSGVNERILDKLPGKDLPRPCTP